MTEMCITFYENLAPTKAAKHKYGFQYYVVFFLGCLPNLHSEYEEQTLLLHINNFKMQQVQQTCLHKLASPLWMRQNGKFPPEDEVSKSCLLVQLLNMTIITLTVAHRNFWLDSEQC